MDGRTVVGSIVAPLWLPGVVAITGPYSLHHLMASSHAVQLEATIAAILAYIGMFAFGAPLYWLLGIAGKRAAWSTILLGFVVAILTYLVFRALVEMGFGVDLAQSILRSIPLSWAELTALSKIGIPGMLVGLTFWIIARPVRHDTATDEPSEGEAA